MEPIILTDKSTIPDDDLISKILGRRNTLWKQLFSRIHEVSPDIVAEWRWYNDGKCWLMKVTRKSKTLIWIGVMDKAFRATFYFPYSAGAIIEKSDLTKKLKIKFRNAKKISKTNGVTITVNNARDVNDILELLQLKRLLTSR